MTSNYLKFNAEIIAKMSGSGSILFMIRNLLILLMKLICYTGLILTHLRSSLLMKILFTH